MRVGVWGWGLALLLWFGSGVGRAQRATLPGRMPEVARHGLALQHFGADAPWFEKNIPFLEIDDPEMQAIYYYRWKLYRSHVREIGAQGTMVTEFLEDVPWARHPFTDLNDSSSFHLLEGRWLRSPAVVNSLIDHLYTGGGNDRHFSESLASAAESTTWVTGEAGPALRHLDTMQYVYNQWDDHFDRGRNLYWVEPIADATEYTIASIDASGAGFTDKPSTDQNRNGFTGGFAFRPSINAYQFANAQAIARLARRAGQEEVAADYAGRAERIRAAVLEQLWNPELVHFTDRYQRSTKFVTAGELIRGRELVGYVPWMYGLPPKEQGTAAYGEAWRHVLAETELAGPRGLRTVEPTYARYLAQYRYDAPSGRPECQWNGPSWPFQTSQTLTAMARLLTEYPETGVTRADYVRLLRQYTHQHFLAAGHPDLQEDYDPDRGGPIVGLARSHHYNHSTYVDLVLSGLVGVKPRADEVLEVNPLVGAESGIHWFALDRLRYHGREVGVVYDADGKHYGVGAGLSLFVEGKRVWGPGPLGRVEVRLTARRGETAEAEAGVRAVDLAVNVGVPDGPRATASSSLTPEGAMQGIDGRMWFYPEIANGWSPADAEKAGASWYAVDLRRRVRVGSVKLFFFADGAGFRAPGGLRLEYRDEGEWRGVGGEQRAVANGETLIQLPGIWARELRVRMEAPGGGANVQLVEFEAFAPGR